MRFQGTAGVRTLFAASLLLLVVSCAGKQTSAAGGLRSHAVGNAGRNDLAHTKVVETVKNKDINTPARSTGTRSANSSSSPQVPWSPDFTKQLGLPQEYHDFFVEVPGDIQGVTEADGKLYFTIHSAVAGVGRGPDEIRSLNLSTQKSESLYPPSRKTVFLRDIVASAEYLVWTGFYSLPPGSVPKGAPIPWSTKLFPIKCMNLSTKQISIVPRANDPPGTMPFMAISGHLLFFDDFVRGEGHTGGPPTNLSSTVTEFDLDAMKPVRVFSTPGASLFYPTVYGNSLAYTKYADGRASVVVWNLSTNKSREYQYQESIWEPSLGNGMLYVKASPVMASFGRILKMPLSTGEFSPILGEDKKQIVGYAGLTPEATDFGAAWFPARPNAGNLLPVYNANNDRFVAMQAHAPMPLNGPFYLYRIVGSKNGYLFWAGDAVKNLAHGENSESFIAGIYGH